MIFKFFLVAKEVRVIHDAKLVPYLITKPIFLIFIIISYLIEQYVSN